MGRAVTDAEYAEHWIKFPPPDALTYAGLKDSMAFGQDGWLYVATELLLGRYTADRSGMLIKLTPCRDPWQYMGNC